MTSARLACGQQKKTPSVLPVVKTPARELSRSMSATRLLTAPPRKGRRMPPSEPTFEQWLARHEDALLAILLRGYVVADRDPAMCFRRMCTETKLLRERLKVAYEDLIPPKPVNNKPASPESRPAQR